MHVEALSFHILGTVHLLSRPGRGRKGTMILLKNLYMKPINCVQINTI